MSFLNRGEGADVLLLHGYGSKKESFYYQTERLSERFCVTAPDFPFFGLSEGDERAWSVGDYADWLLKFMDARKLFCPNVIAHSFGARVALKLFSAHGDRVKQLIITGGAGLVKPRSPQYMRRIRAYRRVKRLFPKFAERHYGSDEYKKLSPVMKESYKKIVNEDLKCCANLISVPTLLVYGADDNVTPACEEGEIFHSLIKGSILQVVEGGHFCFSEQPEKFNNIIYNFLSEK